MLNAIAGFWLCWRSRIAKSTEKPRVVSPADSCQHAGSAIASGAKNALPRRTRYTKSGNSPRALYALSLPLGLVLVMLHLVAKPQRSRQLSQRLHFQVHFAPVRDGLRYIEVDDPRSRRSNKLGSAAVRIRCAPGCGIAAKMDRIDRQHDSTAT